MIVEVFAEELRPKTATAATPDHNKGAKKAGTANSASSTTGANVGKEVASLASRDGTSPPPHAAARTRCGVTVWKGVTHFIGGTTMMDVASVDESGTWKAVAPQGKAPIPRTNFAFAENEDTAQVFISGGLAFGGTTLLDDVHELHLGTMTWSPIAQKSSLARRFNHAMVHAHGSLYVFGGEGRLDRGGSQSATTFGDLMQFDQATKCWVTMSPASAGLLHFETPCARSCHAMCFSSGTGDIFLHGGIDDSGAVLGDFWRLNLREKRAPTTGSTAEERECQQQFPVHFWRRIEHTESIPRMCSHVMLARTLASAGGGDSQHNFAATLCVLVGDATSESQALDLHDKEGLVALYISRRLEEVPGMTEQVDEALRSLPASIPSMSLLGLKLGHPIDFATRLDVVHSPSTASAASVPIPRLMSPGACKVRGASIGDTMRLVVCGGVRGIAATGNILRIDVKCNGCL